MADPVDLGNEQAQKTLDALIEERRSIGIPAGPPGECEYCGDYVPRLINGICPPCRDEFGED